MKYIRVNRLNWHHCKQYDSFLIIYCHFYLIVKSTRMIPFVVLAMDEQQRQTIYHHYPGYLNFIRYLFQHTLKPVKVWSMPKPFWILALFLYEPFAIIKLLVSERFCFISFIIFQLIWITRLWWNHPLASACELCVTWSDCGVVFRSHWPVLELPIFCD